MRVYDSIDQIDVAAGKKQNINTPKQTTARNPIRKDGMINSLSQTVGSTHSCFDACMH